MLLAAGKILTGRCATLDGESVRTQFFFLGPFLLPVDSVYSTTSGSIPIRRSATSIALTYLRWVIGPIAFFGTFIGLTGNDRTLEQLGSSDWLTLLAVAGVWLAVIFLTGRARGKDARQRRSLAQLVKHGAPPEILFDGALAFALDELQRKWESVAPAHVAYRVDATTKVKWRDLYPKDVAPDLLYLYYALCRYEAAKSGEETMSNRAGLAWARIEREI